MHRFLALFVLVAVAPSVGAAPNGDVMVVPGGVESLRRLYRLDRSDDRLGETLNRVLLGSISPDHDWASIEERAALDTFLDVVAEIEASWPDGTIATYEGYVGLLSILGFEVRLTVDGPELTPLDDGAEGARRRRAAGALGWDLPGVWRTIGAGRSVELVLRTGEAPPPIDLDTWSRIAGARVDPATALRTLARDQRSGLVIEALRRIDDDTRRAIDREGLLVSLHDDASIAFYRHAAALEVRNGRLLAPGGPDAAAAWEREVGARLDDPRDFVAALLRPDRHRLAVLWSALFFAEPGTVAALLRRPADERSDRLAMLADAMAGIDDLTAPDYARGRGPGVGTMVRALAVDPATGRLELPGGARLWFEALDGTKIPDTLEKLETRAADWAGSDLSDGEFLRLMLEERVHVGPFDRPLLPRWVGAVGLFERDSPVLTPENVVLLTRTVDARPMALAPLRGMRLVDPASLRDYLRAVRALDSLRHSPRTYELVASFQGGVALLRSLWEAGRLDDALLDDLLGRWARLHLDQDDPRGAAPAQLDWLESLMRGLPAAPADAPGRGPLERALLEALLHRDDEQRFDWKGLSYTGHRGTDVAGVWAEHLSAQGIPSVDALVELHGLRRGLTQACRDADLDETRRIVDAIDAALASLPAAEVWPTPARDELRSWFEALDRAGSHRAVARFRDAGTPRKLGRMEDTALDIERGLAGDLRSFFLAPAYLPGLQFFDPALLGGASLVRLHALVQHVESQRAVLGDSPWNDVVRGTEAMSGSGAVFIGHLDGVSTALGAMRFVEGGAGGRTPVNDNVGIWFDDLVSTPWRELRPELTIAIHRLLALGRELTGNPTDEAARRLVARVVPAARRPALDGRGVLVSHAELLQIGLDAALTGTIGPSGEAARDALRALGAETQDAARHALAVAGAATPHVDGRYRRHAGPWPAYEALERSGVFEALVERQGVDLRLAVLDYLGRYRLPGDVGADLMAAALRDLATRLQVLTRLDWESIARAMRELDDDYFDEVMRTCLADGRYSLQM